MYGGRYWEAAKTGFCIYMNEVALCKLFVNEPCNKGSQCSFLHPLQAKRCLCKFFLSVQVSQLFDWSTMQL